MASNIETVSVSMASIGAKLKSAREKKALAIDQVQKQTRIHSTVLIALEEGRCDELLTSTYVRSFLKKYAGYLGFDSKQIAKEYESIHPELATQSLDLGSLEPEGSSDLSNIISLIKFIAVTIIVLFIVGVSIKAVTGYFKSRRVKEAGAVKYTPVAVQRKKVSRGRISQESESGLSQIPVPVKGPLNLVIKVKQPVLIQPKSDGVLLFKRVLQKGAVETISADDSISVHIAKAEAVDVTLNGRPIPLGKGVIRNLEITRKGVRIR